MPCVETPSPGRRWHREKAHALSPSVSFDARLAQFAVKQNYSLVKFRYGKWGISLPLQTD